MSRHTPGPWLVERQNPSPTTGEWMIAGARPGYLAEVRDCGSGDVIANANLIAAAPDLLEALIRIAQFHDFDRSTADLASCMYDASCIAKSVIAKATGENQC